MGEGLRVHRLKRKRILLPIACRNGSRVGSATDPQGARILLSEQ